MSDEKKMDSELLFKLRPARAAAFQLAVNPVSLRVGDEVRRALASIANTPPVLKAKDYAAIAASVRVVTLAAASVDATAALRAVEAMRGVFAIDYAAMIASAHVFVEETVRIVESAHRALSEAVASMSEEECEELRRAIEDAPLSPVDVNAPGVM